MLQAAGASSNAAVATAALVGPAQVCTRLVEFGLFRSFHPIFSARIASVLHPIGATFIALFGVPGILAFALLHGAGNGMITIVKGSLPLALFGPRGYGRRSGLRIRVNSAGSRNVTCSPMPGRPGLLPPDASHS